MGSNRWLACGAQWARATISHQGSGWYSSSRPVSGLAGEPLGTLSSLLVECGVDLLLMSRLGILLAELTGLLLGATLLVEPSERFAGGQAGFDEAVADAACAAESMPRLGADWI